MRTPSAQFTQTPCATVVFGMWSRKGGRADCHYRSSSPSLVAGLPAQLEGLFMRMRLMTANLQKLPLGDSDFSKLRKTVEAFLRRLQF